MIKQKLRAFAAVAAGLATVATGAALTAPAHATTTATASTAQAAAISNTLLPGQRLLSGQYIRSTDRQWTLVMRASGNVELVRTGDGPVWQTGTARPGSVLVMERDGSMSIIHGRTKYWIGGAKASPNAKLVLPTDGLLTIYNTLGRSVWNRHMIIETMSPGGALWAPGQRFGPVSMFSRNRVYTLQMRPNGALELMKNNQTKLWSAPYKPQPDSSAHLFADGTFAVHNNFNLPYWSIATRRSGTVLQLRDDGKLLMIHGRTVVKVLH
jgi:hypothetical protein